MKKIDLLNKISNGEEAPKKIKCDGEEYKITKILLEDNNYWLNYINEDMECIFPININHLNDEVEVIEDNKKIEKLDIELSPDDGDKVNGYLVCEVTRDIAFKINEIIEVLNEKD